MSHCDTVVDGDGIELGGITAHCLYLLLYNLTYLMEMGVSGNELRE